MNRGIVLLLVFIVLIGLGVLYALERGPALFLKPPSDMRIAFVSDMDGRPNIWTMGMDGSDKRRVTNDAGTERAPAWSPEGTEIAYVSDQEGGVYQVFIAAWNGKYSRRMTTSAGTKDMPVWSRDGKRLSFLSSAKVYEMARHGGDERQYLPPRDMPPLGMTSGLGAPYVYAAWSPAQNYLLFVQETDQGLESYVAEIEPGHQPLTEDIKPLDIVTARSVDVAWAPSGVRVAAGYIGRGSDSGLLVADMDAVDITELLQPQSKDIGAARPAWSPDGRKIAFEMWTVKDGRPDKCRGIYTIGASGSRPRLVVSGDALEPAWSPDGKYIAYTVGREDGRRDLWRVNADGTGAANLTNSEGDNHSPVWSPARRK